MLSLLLICAVQTSREAPVRSQTELAAQFDASAAVVVAEWAGPEHLGAPLAIDVDWRGRVWVLEGGAQPRLAILDDSSGAGACDRVSVFHTLAGGPARSGLAVVGRDARIAVGTAWLGISDVDANTQERTVAALALPWSCANGCGLGALGGPDGRVWFLASDDPGSMRVAHTDGQRVAVFGDAPQRAQSLTLDSFGNVFASERAGEGPGRVAHLAPNSRAGASWSGGDPCGLVSYESNAIGELENTLLVADRTGRLRALRLVDAGASFAFEARDVLAARSAERQRAFAPIDVAVGLDGSLFVLDEGGGEGARILRLVALGRRAANPRLSLAVPTGQLSSLLSPAANVRATAFELIAAQRDELAPRLQDVARSRNPRWQARALWLLARGGPPSRAFVREQLSHSDPNLRLCALRALAAAGEERIDLARRFRGDSSVAARAEALGLLAGAAWADKREALLALLAPWPAGDAVFLDALARAVGSELEAFLAAAPSAGANALGESERAELAAGLRARLQSR